MYCRNCHKRLSAYLDGELSGRELRKMQDHLDGCAPCRARLAGLEALGASMAAPAAPEIPGDLEFRIMARASREYFDTRNERPSRELVRRWLGMAATASALTLGLVLGGVLGWSSHVGSAPEQALTRTGNAVFASLSAAPEGSIEAAVLAGFGDGGRF